MLRCIKFVGTGIVLGLLVWAACGCSPRFEHCSGKIVEVYEYETGWFTTKKDWATVIEYPNGQRSAWRGKFGEVGEVITVNSTKEKCTDD